MNKLKLGIVGASGLVGQTLLTILKEENLLSNFDLYLFTSEKNEGVKFEFEGNKYVYIKLSDKSIDLKLNYIIFSAGDEISKEWAEKFSNSGTIVIDNSNAFRKCDDIPLVVPEINGNLINKKTRIIANPNCSTIQLAIVVDKIRKLSKIEQIIVSSYQSVSGAGKLAVHDLKFGTNFNFDCDIKKNIIPQIGLIEENGFCKEENKIIFELNKILDEKISVAATAVRVPVENCHGESVYIKLSQNIDKTTIKTALKCNYIEYSDEIYQNSDCFNKNKTYVCRLRKFSDNEYLMFIFADNLRRGAAYNAILILKILIELNNNKNIQNIKNKNKKH